MATPRRDRRNLKPFSPATNTPQSPLTSPRVSMQHRRSSSLPQYHHLRQEDTARHVSPSSLSNKITVIFAACVILSITIVIVFDLTAKRPWLHQPIGSLRTGTRLLRHRPSSNGSPGNVSQRLEWDEELWNVVTSGPNASTHPRLPDNRYLVVVVASAPSNFQRRAAIRRSWNGTRTSTLIVFLVGQSTDRDLTNQVLLEADVKRDVLVGSYLDVYRNLTLKTVHGLLWSHRTLQPQYVLKTDDDCFVNLKVLLRLLRAGTRNDQPLYAGNMRWESHVIRDPSNRWYVPERALRATRYPPYGSGAGYLLNGEALRHFVDVVKYVKPFPNEDAYVGVVLRTANVRPVQSARFATRSSGLWICNFLYLVVVHGVPSGEQGLFAEKVEAAEAQCRGAEVDVDWN